MDSQNFLFVICIVMFTLYLHIVSAHRGLALRKLIHRIESMEIRLDEQTSKISELEMLLNSTGAHSSDTQGKKHFSFLVRDLFAIACAKHLLLLHFLNSYCIEKLK